MSRGGVAAVAAAALVVTHDLNLAARFATHVLVIGPGRHLHQGPAESTMNEVVLSAAFGHPVAAERYATRGAAERSQP